MATRYWVGGGSSGNWTATGNTNWGTASGTRDNASVPTNADDVIFDDSANGNTPCTVSAASTCKTITFAGGAGWSNTFTINTSQVLTVAGSITYSSGMTLAGDGTLTLSATATLTSNGKAMPFTFSIGNTTLTLTLADDANSDGPCTLGNGSTQTINGQTWYCSGNFTVTGRVQGTTAFVLDGTGTLTGSSTTTRYISNPLTINTAGTITMAAQGINLGGTFTLTAGTLVTTGSSVTIAASTSLVGSFPSFNNMLVSASSTLTLDNALTVNGTLTVAVATFTLSGNYSVTVGTVSVTANNTFTRVNSLTVTEWYVNAGVSSTVAGAYNQTVGTLTVDRAGTFTFPINQTLTVSTRIDVCGSSKATTTVKSSSASTAFTLTYNGTSANMNIDSATFTDVTATATLYNHNGGTLTRCSGITNHSFNPGDYSSPGASNTKTGVSYTYEGATVNGTYTGSDRWTDPGVSNVRSGTEYKADSTTNNRTGTCAVPTAGNVLIGVSVDNTTGTFDESARNTDPGISNVRSGQSYKIANASKVGTCAVPTAAQVLNGISVDSGTGNVVLPTAGQVESGIPFGPSGGTTGTYDPVTGNFTDPGVSNVKLGEEYVFDGDNLTGTYTAEAATVDDVKAAAPTIIIPGTAPAPSDPPTAEDYCWAFLQGVVS